MRAISGLSLKPRRNTTRRSGYARGASARKRDSTRTRTKPSRSIAATESESSARATAVHRGPGLMPTGRRAISGNLIAQQIVAARGEGKRGCRFPGALRPDENRCSVAERDCRRVKKNRSAFDSQQPPQREPVDAPPPRRIEREQTIVAVKCEGERSTVAKRDRHPVVASRIDARKDFFLRERELELTAIKRR